MMKNIKLLKDLGSGWNFIAAGVIKTEQEWCDITGRLALLPIEGSDKEWFEEVD